MTPNIGGVGIGVAISPVFHAGTQGAGGAAADTRITEASDTRITEAGDTRITE